MKFLAYSIALGCIILFSSSGIEEKPPHNHSKCTSTWGFYGHKRINRMAVFTLPPELFTFYKQHIEFLTDHAVDPDKRRYAAKGEAERHYIDIDHYVHHGEDPFTVVPKTWKAAVEKFSEDTLKAYGIVPWHIDVMVKRLTYAFKDKSLDRILQYSADLGHYVGDAHVPLHTTENYNGQLTNQKGIHGFWESRVPELFAEEYDYLVGRAKYVDNVLDKAWDVVKQSHYAVDSVFKFELELTEQFDSDKKYSFEHRGQVIMKVYSQEFSRAFANKLDHMQERRMRASIHTAGSLWYTAWVNAGQPDLTNIGEEISDDYKSKMNEENNHFKTGKNKGRYHDN